MLNARSFLQVKRKWQTLVDNFSSCIVHHCSYFHEITYKVITTRQYVVLACVVVWRPSQTPSILKMIIFKSEYLENGGRWEELRGVP